MVDPLPTFQPSGEGRSQGCRSRAGAGHPSHGPRLPGSLHPSRKAVDRARLGSVFPEGRAGAGVAGGLLRKATVNSQADVRVG